MKKFLGSLLTLIFVGSTVTPTVSCNKDKANNKVLEPIKKHEITKNNLDEFFKIHNTFEYKGEFFFKDISKQTKEETNRIGRAEEIFDYVIDKLFVKEFNVYFDYINSDYFFQISYMTDIKDFKLNENYLINF